MHRLTLVLSLLVLALIPAATAGSAVQLGYIVVLESGANPGAVAADHAAEYGVNVGFVYRNALKGYSAVIPAASLDALSADARVAYVERDSTVHASTTQTGATWGIDRDRPARLAALRHLHLYGDRRGRQRLRDRHRHPQDALGVRRPRGARRRHDDADRNHLRRLPRPRHARRRHDRRRDLRRRQGRPPDRRPRAHLRRHRPQLRCASLASTGSPATTRPASPPLRT